MATAEGFTALASPPPMTSDEADVDAVVHAISIVSKVITYILAVFELTVIVFIIVQLRQKKLWKSDGFYRILIVGLIVDVIAEFLWFVDVVSFYQIDFLTRTEIFVFTSLTLFIGPWNTCMALNRCTATLLPLSHVTIWTNRHVYIIDALLLIYPLVICWQAIIINPCIMGTWETVCIDQLRPLRLFIFFSNLVQAFLLLLINTLVFFCSRAAAKLTRRFERKMLLHSIFCSLMLVIYSTVQTINTFLYSHSFIISEFLEQLNVVIFAIFQYGSIFVLFWLSPVLRKTYLNFYFCNRWRPARGSVTNQTPMMMQLYQGTTSSSA